MPTVATQHREGARAKIEAKIKILRKYSEGKVPEGVFVPMSLEQFRIWGDPELGVEKIGSKSTLNQIWNRALKAEAQRLIKLLRIRPKRQESRANALDRVHGERDKFRDVSTHLACQLHETRQELRREQRENIRKDNRISELTLSNAELTKRLNQYQSLGRVK
jgi:hypothetical protein